MKRKGEANNGSYLIYEILADFCKLCNQTKQSVEIISTFRNNVHIQNWLTTLVRYLPNKGLLVLEQRWRRWVLWMFRLQSPSARLGLTRIVQIHEHMVCPKFDSAGLEVESQQFAENTRVSLHVSRWYIKETKYTPKAVGFLFLVLSKLLTIALRVRENV